MSSELAFSYSYSAAQNKEAQMIRDKYLPKEESALDELKRLDRTVDNAGMIPSLQISRLRRGNSLRWTTDILLLYRTRIRQNQKGKSYSFPF